VVGKQRRKQALPAWRSGCPTLSLIFQHDRGSRQLGGSKPSVLKGVGQDVEASNRKTDWPTQVVHGLVVAGPSVDLAARASTSRGSGPPPRLLVPLNSSVQRHARPAIFWGLVADPSDSHAWNANYWRGVVLFQQPLSKPFRRDRKITGLFSPGCGLVALPQKGAGRPFVACSRRQANPEGAGRGQLASTSPTVARHGPDWGTCGVVDEILMAGEGHCPTCRRAIRPEATSARPSLPILLHSVSRWRTWERRRRRLRASVCRVPKKSRTTA